MSIFPAGDLIQDVLRAADPARARRAEARLRAASADPSALAQSPGETRPSRAAFTLLPAVEAPDWRTPAAAPRAADPFRAFEAFLLRGMIEAMLPAAGKAEFGQGAGAPIWRSFYAETLGEALAATGRLGIAGRLAASAAAGKAPA